MPRTLAARVSDRNGGAALIATAHCRNRMDALSSAQETMIMTNLATTPTLQPAAPSARHLTLTGSAARRIAALNSQDGSAKMFRITVNGGGCSGFQYDFKLDDQLNDDDVTFERDGSVLVTDQTSLDLIAGSEVDFIENLMGAHFEVHNPNAVSSCGCGTSFAIG
jgi:iron-sulfur cluster insertion protein